MSHLLPVVVAKVVSPGVSTCGWPSKVVRHIEAVTWQPTYMSPKKARGVEICMYWRVGNWEFQAYLHFVASSLFGRGAAGNLQEKNLLCMMARDRNIHRV